MNSLEVVTASGADWWDGRGVLWIVDGRDLRDWIAEVERKQRVHWPGNYWGALRNRYCDPIRMALGESSDPLTLFEEDEAVRPYVWLAVCSCGNDGCGSVMADLALDAVSASWTDLRVVSGGGYSSNSLGMSFTFDIEQYREALRNHRQLVADPRPARP